jgi:predicted kinase
MVGAIEAGQADAGQAADLSAEAREYLALAFAFLEPSARRLIAIGGLSGTGKSTLAAALAPLLAALPGAVVLRSDLIRKRLFAARPEQRLGAEAYEPAANRAVYDRLETLAEDGLAAGQVVVLDAVFARAGERARVKAIAHAAHVPFHGLWLEAPPDILRARIGARVGDPSDATAAVLDRQLDYDLGAIEWTRVDVSGGHAAVIAQARRALDGA